ncbi:hypothetical protein [Pandoraea aquatica]|uniref:hypothetical protein n=1 Tax=Pandoraea aquatica TaxID=2508290 RepID=UPI001241EBB4|nr:hypothetical protein [Pandoraea aquatica]
MTMGSPAVVVSVSEGRTSNTLERSPRHSARVTADDGTEGGAVCERCASDTGIDGRMSHGGLSGRCNVCQKSRTKVWVGVPGSDALEDEAVMVVADAVVAVVDVSPLTETWPVGAVGV